VGKGTGLGLSVSRQLIRAVGGELELARERSSLGGAKFIIRLPKAQEGGVIQ
jgi:signal transduction histidine kinase